MQIKITTRYYFIYLLVWQRRSLLISSIIELWEKGCFPVLLVGMVKWSLTLEGNLQYLWKLFVSRTIGNNLTIAGVVRQDMVCSHAGTLHGNSKEHMRAIHINMDWSQKYTVEWKEQFAELYVLYGRLRGEKKTSPRKSVPHNFCSVGEYPGKDTYQIVRVVISRFVTGKSLKRSKGTSSICIILCILGK